MHHIKENEIFETSASKKDFLFFMIAGILIYFFVKLFLLRIVFNSFSLDVIKDIFKGYGSSYDWIYITTSILCITNITLLLLIIKKIYNKKNKTVYIIIFLFINIIILIPFGKYENGGQFSQFCGTVSPIYKTIYNEYFYIGPVCY